MKRPWSAAAAVLIFALPGCSAHLGDDESDPAPEARDEVRARDDTPRVSHEVPTVAAHSAEVDGEYDAGKAHDLAPERADPCGPHASTLSSTASETLDGTVMMRTSGEVEILRLRATLTVPSAPHPRGDTLFVWPGLQPGRASVGSPYGVLQPVLTWGTSCVPAGAEERHGWWISGVYVGVPAGGSAADLACEGGETMNVEVGDQLDLEMVLNGTVWTQRITHRSTAKTVDFSIDLKGQKQQILVYRIEQVSEVKPVDDVIFDDVEVTLSSAQPNACMPRAKGAREHVSSPRVSADGRTCCISRIILRGENVPPSSPNIPE